MARMLEIVIGSGIIVVMGTRMFIAIVIVKVRSRMLKIVKIGSLMLKIIKVGFLMLKIVRIIIIFRFCILKFIAVKI